jgi:hypothetical protein
MKRMRSFLKTSLLGGFAVILPITVSIFIFKWLFNFVHSALTQGRILVKDPVRARRLFHKAKADLIVLGTHGKTGTNAFWSGSTAPRVCAGCDVPILLVPVTQ